MKRHLPIFFAWISLAFLAYSCASPRIIMVEKQDITINEMKESDAAEKLSYKARVSYQGKELQGIVMVKKSKDGEYRVAFYNEMGLTFLEGTMDGKRFFIHNIIPVLDNKTFIRKFKKTLYKHLH